LGCRCWFTCSSYTHKWKTKYKIWTYSEMGWHDNGDVWFDGYFLQ
jgi:hypothetical protein